MNAVKGRTVLFLVIAPFVLTGAALGWLRESRSYRTAPPVTAELETSRLLPIGIAGAPAEVYFASGSVYEKDAYNLSQGKRLYDWFGCPACHGDGRGKNGPSFLDGWWLYGPDMVSIVASIRNGRPHGMPAFRDRMTEEQIWQLAGYVETIGAYKALIAAPSRNDGIHTRPSENRAPAVVLFEQGPVGNRREQGPTP